MDSQQRKLPQNEPEKYEAPAGKDLGNVAELTASATCYPSTQHC